MRGAGRWAGSAARSRRTFPNWEKIEFSSSFSVSILIFSLRLLTAHGNAHGRAGARARSV